MNLNDSNKLNRANYEIDLMNWHGHANRINNKNRLSYSSLDKMILNNNLDYLFRRAMTASDNWRNTFSVSSQPIHASVTLLPYTKGSPDSKFWLPSTK